jgi:anti-anti-sigma factor
MSTDAASIRYEDESDKLRMIYITGRLDIEGVNVIDTKFAALSASAARRIVLDLTGVDFLASIGIRSLISNGKALQQRGGRMVLFLGENASVTKVLKTMGIDTLLPIHADIESARADALA